MSRLANPTYRIKTEQNCQGGVVPLPARRVADVSTVRREADPGVELMLRVQQDEPGAFAELVERYWSLLFGRFFRQLGDRQEAEDLAQDVFLRLYRYRQRYRARAKFTTWLFHISRNVTRNALRTRRRKPCVPMGTLTGPEAESAPTARPMTDRNEPPTRPLERAELAGMVRGAVATLGRRQRVALELFQFQNQSC
ncbi:MAG: sigma-70 family RNA polymerase sigma factor, partial [Planctomycetia bacterium]|nr:sigma-70 family RNA polymerase sigma factor [Planctomycetia bacterium]